MNNPKITINGKEIEMKKLTVNDWLEMAAIYDKINTPNANSVEFMQLHCTMLELAFGISQDEIKALPADEIVPTYVNITIALKDILTARINDDEKKSVTTI